MKNLLIIGDVHGKINEYQKIINNTDLETIQVGDFGFRKEHLWHLENVVSSKHKINFGNHDDYNFLKEKHSLKNYFISDDYMTVRGAYSIDKAFRTENLDWFENEELTYSEMLQVMDEYVNTKPKVMITHDCPQIVREYLFNIYDKSITSNGLDAMFEVHQPEIWVFGHHHKSKDVQINGTRFICLSELETFNL